jgi:hypothetical protein
MRSDPMYAYGISLLPAERVTEAVMRLNYQLAHAVREAGAMFTLPGRGDELGVPGPCRGRPRDARSKACQGAGTYHGPQSGAPDRVG